MIFEAYRVEVPVFVNLEMRGFNIYECFKLLDIRKFVLCSRRVLQKLSDTDQRLLNSLTLDHLEAIFALEEVVLAIVGLLDRDKVFFVRFGRYVVCVLRLLDYAEVAT